MPAWLLPALSSLATAGMAWLGHKGQSDVNRMNIEMAREQMRFQERMSNTAAQRSIEDYKRAGLNPALAYERSASSPGGASAVLGNPIAAGISTAQAYRAQRQAMQIERQKADADLGLARSQMALLHNQSEKTGVETANLRQAAKFAALLQPHDNRRVAAEATLAELMLPGAKNTADYEKLLGRAGKGFTTAKTVSEILKTLSGIRRD